MCDRVKQTKLNRTGVAQRHIVDFEAKTSSDNVSK